MGENRHVIAPASAPSATRDECAEYHAPPHRVDNIRFRAIRPDDWHRLQLFHDRLTATSVQLRFHGAKRHLSEPLAHRLTQVDGHDTVAVVATTGTRGRIVGVARYFRLDRGTAEVAFVVEDAYQGQGIGRRLMQKLVGEARRNGISEFVADVLPSNTRMLRLLEESGPIRVRNVDGVDEVRVDLPAAP